MEKTPRHPPRKGPPRAGDPRPPSSASKPSAGGGPPRPHYPRTPFAGKPGSGASPAASYRPRESASGGAAHGRVDRQAGGVHEREDRNVGGLPTREDHHAGGDRRGGDRRAREEQRARPQDAPAGRDLIFGVEPVRELIGAAPGAIRILYVKAGAEARFAAEIDAVRTQGGNVIRSEDEALARMAGSEARHQGLVAIMREYQYAAFEDVVAEAHDPLLVIDGVTDPRNLGAIMRSAECAGVRAIVIARDRTVGITPIVVKSSAGAWVHLRIARCGNVAQALEGLKAAGYWVVALAPSGDLSIYDLDTSRRLAFVLGSEGRGVREIVKKSSDFIAGIPMRGRIGSLNVSVAAAVALFEVARRRLSVI
jgi:23S rRNA (guanosine2251-2'-O)-methyltransferase